MRFQIVIVLCCASTLTGCYLFKKKRKPENHFILRDSIALDRLDTNKSARLLFKTQGPASCELRIRTQEASKGTQLPVTRPCSNTSPRTEHVELIDDLREDTLYAVEVYAWAEGKDINQADRVDVLENGGQGLGGNVYVFRVNIPTRLAEIHQYLQPTPILLEQVFASLPKEASCQKGSENTQPNFYSASTGLGLEKMSLQGFISGEARPHQSDKNRLRLAYNAISYGDVLRWQLKQNQKDIDFVTQGFASFHSVSIVHPQPLELKPSSIGLATQTIQNNSDIKLQWVASHLSANSYVQVQVGHPGEENSFQCYYPAASGEATIPFDNYLATLSEKNYDVTVSLVQLMLKLFPGKQVTPWIITAYDWRTLRVERI